MKSIQKISAVAALLCIGAAGVQAGTYHLTAITSGNWNSAGIRTSSHYQIGFSTELPNEQGDYFEFNSAPLKGKTVNGAYIVIPGSTDYSIQSYWGNPDNGNPSHIQFKVRVAGQGTTGSHSLSTILTGNNNSTLYLDLYTFNRNPNNGYRWVADGLHTGAQFDAWHYESVGTGEGGKKMGHQVQNAVNAGAPFCMETYSGYDLNQAGQRPPENYIWGGTSFNTGIIMTITTSN